MRLLVILGLLFASLQGIAQEFSPRFAIGVKYMGMTVHLKKSPHPHIYKWNFDKKGIGVWNHGLVLIAEYFVKPEVSFRLSQALIPYDCAGVFLGGTQVGLSYGKFIRTSPHELRITAGPMWFYRKSWKEIPGYIDEGLFKSSKNGKWQTKFVWHGGEVEYNYWTSNNQAFSMNWMPGVPELFTFAPGIKMAAE